MLRAAGQLGGCAISGAIRSARWAVNCSVDAAAVKSSAWQELLSANALVSPNAYVYMEASKDLVLMRVERNLDISPASMRAWVDSIIDVTIAMHPKWKQFSPPPKS